MLWVVLLQAVGGGVNHIMLCESCKDLGLPDVTAFLNKLTVIR